MKKTSQTGEWPVKVIFRIFLDSKECIALFPETPASYDPALCQSYAHFGQHSGASVTLLSGPETRRAFPTEYKALQAELEAIGYTNLVVCEKASARMHKVRLQEINRMYDL